MSVCGACQPNRTSTVEAFDQIAEAYDELFTRSAIGRAQRSAVWDVLGGAFQPGDRVLELNCGTGEDALFLGRSGVSVLACDGSSAMVEVARKRKAREGPELPVEFRVCPNEKLQRLAVQAPLFDGALSNFSGLNCIEDLRSLARELAPIMKDGARLIFCLSTRICIWEILWFSSRLNFRKAFRRTSGSAIGHIGEAALRVYYPTLRQIRRAFAPLFRLTLVRAIGLFVPPSYLEFWATKHPRLITHLAGADRVFGRLPILRAVGDHALLRFQKVSS
jgi:ubiquinone/menaquinone biosynthesis C-methylase UbiE